MKENLARKIKRLVKDKGCSISSLVAEAVGKCVRELKRKGAVKKLLRFSGKVQVAPDALEEFEKGRQDEGRL